MAFVRWRGNSVTTLYDQGRSRQVRLACLGGAYYVWPEVQAQGVHRIFVGTGLPKRGTN